MVEDCREIAIGHLRLRVVMDKVPATINSIPPAMTDNHYAVAAHPIIANSIHNHSEILSAGCKWKHGAINHAVTNMNKIATARYDKYLCLLTLAGKVLCLTATIVGIEAIAIGRDNQCLAREAWLDTVKDRPP